jgi:hypothetical protein
MDPNTPPPPPERPADNPPESPAYEVPPYRPADSHPTKPVAYDQYGRPLYAHPPKEPQFVHMARSLQPIDQNIPPEIMKRHEESLKKFPNLNLSRGEFVISAVKRHWIGLLKIWGIALALMIALTAMFVFFFLGDDSVLASTFEEGTLTSVGVALLGAMFVLVSIGAFIATYVYNSNEFYLTNESVIQEIQTSLFTRHEQTVSLINIEDASYKQAGIIPHLLNYGTIRLSTEGDETTYMFNYVRNPKQHIAVLNNAVEAFKNGRPVELHENESN